MRTIKVNGEAKNLKAPDQKPLLWALREDCGLSGTKFGCGIGVCGACTVHMGGVAVRSCITPLAAVSGAVRTIEGVKPATGGLHPVQEAWIAETVSQCGYCQPGQIMAAIALLEAHPQPSEEEIAAAMTNLCRCGTYPRIRRAILRAAAAGARK